MIISTTSSIDNKTVSKYLGLVDGEVIVGVNIFKDIFAAVRDIVGGRSVSYENELVNAKKTALDEMIKRAKDKEADAIIGVKFDYETVGKGGSMLLVCVTGTAVKFK